MNEESSFDSLFHRAVAAIDSGDEPSLELLLTQHLELVRQRLESPGGWLRDKVGNALDGFFRQPYLLWFIAEDPVRTGKLPSNIAKLGQTIIHQAEHERVESLQEQLDFALKLVSWSLVARESGVQLDLIDVLVDAGASHHGNPDDAIVNGNFEAARHLLERGAQLTLATALCLERWEDAAHLAQAATGRERQFALVLSSLKGKAEAIAKLIGFGVDVNAHSEDHYPHASPLHHAVGSGSISAVKVLVDAGAALDARDTVYHGTPLGWAEYEKQSDIAAYLRLKMKQ